MQHLRNTVEVKGIGPVLVSTIAVPVSGIETCLFWQGDSEVVAHYAGPAAAQRGHARLLDPEKLEAIIDRVRAERREQEEVCESI